MKQLLAFLMLCGAACGQQSLFVTPPWTPSALGSDLLAWYDASDTNTISETAGLVSQWDDKSGNGYHAKQGTGSAQPETDTATIGGLNALDFDGTDDHFDVTNRPGGPSNDQFVAFVFTRPTAGIISQVDGGSGSGPYSMWWHNNNTIYTRLGTSLGTHNPANTSTGNLMTVSIRNSANQVWVNVNGTIQGSKLSLGAPDANTYIDIGKAQSAEHKGAIGEIIYGLDNSTATVQKVEGYLAHKWRLDGNLPSDHPYKSHPPDWYGNVGQRSMVTPWTPASTTTYVWYDAMDSSSITAPGGSVSQWNDKSGNGFHLVQSTGSLQPSLIGNAIDFNADILKSQAANVDIGEDCTIFLVLNPDVITSGQVLNSGASPSKNCEFAAGNNFRFRSFINPGDTSITASATADVDTIFVSQMQSDSARGLVIWRNGTEAAVTSLVALANASAATLNIGAHPNPTAYYDGDIREVIVVNSVLSDADRERFEGYLAHKWGLETNLPAAHSYRSHKPVGDMLVTAAWDLTSLGTNVIAWYDASDSDTITEAAGSVSQWDDKSTSARHLVQTVGASQPDTGVTINNLSAIHFDGEWMTNTAASKYAGTTLAVFGVWQRVSGKNNFSAVNVRDSAKTTDWQWDSSGVLVYEGVNEFGKLGSWRNGQKSQGTHPGNVAYQFGSVFNGTLNTAYINGTAQTAVSSTGSWDWDQIFVGIRGLTPPSITGDHYYGEFFIVSGAMTDATRQTIEGYLAWKWGLVGNLPSDHPYKKKRP